MFSKLRIAQEYIAVQQPESVSQVKILFEGILEKLDQHKDLSGSKLLAAIPEFKMLEEFTEKRFGIGMLFVHSNTIPMGVLPLFLNKHHIFLDSYFHGFNGLDHQEVLLKSWDKQKGTVDLKNAKVGGIFSTYKHRFFINIRFFAKTIGLTASEFTAVYLHEIGHLFNNFEFSNRTEYTNTLMANLAQELKVGTDKKKLEYIYKEYIELVGATEDKDLLTNGESRVVIGNKAFSNYFKYIKSQWPNSKYAETNSEASADLFAARFGYGRDLNNALYKITGGSTVAGNKGGIGYDQATLSMIGNVLDGITVGIPLAAIAVSLTAGAIVSACGLGLFLMLNIYGSGSNNKDMTYDDLKDRYLRIRQQLVEILKDSDLPQSEVKNMLEAIYSADKIIKSVAIYKPMLAKIADVLFTSHRRADNDIKLQRLLEEMAHNNLFVKSAEFSLAAKQA